MKKIWMKKAGYWKFIIVYVLFILALNLLAGSRSFCDFYTDNIFGFWSGTYGRLTGLFPFSVGEVLVIVAVLTVLAAFVLGVLRFFWRRKTAYCKIFSIYMKSWFVFLLTVLLVMTLNCSILYNCSKLSVNGNGDKTYTVKELEILRNYIVGQCNSHCHQVERDEDANAVYPGNLDATAKEAMRSLSREYPRLSGYYPTPKKLWSSYLMYQSGTIGMYFPFSMEANCSRYINDLFYGNTACHELSHLKGYIYEDEANFIAYLACVNSDDAFLQYSGYIGVLDYVDGDYLDAAGGNTYQSQIEIDSQVISDDWCYNEDVVDEVEEQEFIIDDEVIRQYSEDFVDSYLEYYGAEANYSEVTLLLLQYYDGILY